MNWWRVKAAANAVNGSTAVGLFLAAAGRARISRGPRGLVLAHGFGPAFPRAAAFTVGNVVLTRHDETWWTAAPMMLLHEERHSWQYAVTLGLPMLPLYALASGWSWVRGGDPWAHNVFEMRAGLADGGYPTVSRRHLRRQRAA